MDTKNVLLTIGAAGAIATGALVVTHHQPLDSKPGYQVEATGGDKYDVYTLKDGKKVIMGKDLTAEQADQFLNHKIGRHNK